MELFGVKDIFNTKEFNTEMDQNMEKFPTETIAR